MHLLNTAFHPRPVGLGLAWLGDAHAEVARLGLGLEQRQRLRLRLLPLWVILFATRFSFFFVTSNRHTAHVGLCTLKCPHQKVPVQSAVAAFGVAWSWCSKSVNGRRPRRPVQL